MSGLDERCSVCRALLDEEDLFCANCGAEAPDREAAESATYTAEHRFTCQGCGASMSYDASAQALACPFCGSQQLDRQEDGAVLRPQRVVPFAVDREAAEATLRTWLGSSFWRPADLARTAVLTNVRQVYVPYWVFAADTFTNWTADSSQTPPAASGDWVPLSGEHRGRYAGLLVGASSVLTPAETAALCPFDLARGLPLEEVDLGPVTVEDFQVARKHARPLARSGLEQSEAQACRSYVPGQARNVKVNVRLHNLRGEPVLLPVWIMAYRYRDRVFRFLANGQTGQSSGRAPRSVWKLLLVIGLALGFVLAVLALIALAAAAV